MLIDSICAYCIMKKRCANSFMKGSVVIQGNHIFIRELVHESEEPMVAVSQAIKV
jgi:hypothetical protein